jgi:repressor LexA
MIKDPTYRNVVQVDHLGHVGAGTTVEFFDHPRAQLILKPEWVTDLRQVCTVTVSGDSLVDEGILDGDILIVKRIFDAAEIKAGKLVIAVLPTNRCVVKRIYFRGERIILKSANPKYQDMIFYRDQLRIDGIVKELKRKLD